MSVNAEITGGPTAEDVKEAEIVKEEANEYFKSTYFRVFKKSY